MAALAALAYLFPATVLGIMILLAGMSPEKLLEPVLSTFETRTYHRILMLLVLAPALVIWVSSERRFMRRDERVVFLSYMVGTAVLTFAANTLSSPSAIILLFAAALVIQRARQRAAETAPWPFMAASPPPPWGLAPQRPPPHVA